MSEKSHPVLSDDQIASALTPFKVQLSTGQIAQIRDYVLLLLKWNQSVSLTSIVDPLEMVARHFGESMFISCLIPVKNCRLADLGSGAGFPGLALKIVAPTLRIRLIERSEERRVGKEC